MSRIVRSLCGASCAAAFLTIVACAGTNQGRAAPGTEVGVASAQKADSAVVERLAAARCDREETCNNVGAGQKYASRDTCMDVTRGNLANDLNAYQCPRGIDQDQVDRCIAAIRENQRECGHPLATLSRMEKCSASALCMK